MDVEVASLDKNLSPVWKKLYGGTSTYSGGMLCQDTDGACSTSSKNVDVKDNYGLADIWFLKLSTTGAILQSETYGGSENDAGKSCVLDGRGNLLVASETNSTDKTFSGWAPTGKVNALHGVVDSISLK